MQIDGSHHPWLEDRGPKLTLLIAVDDATGTVAQAVFRTSEDTRGYLVLLEGPGPSVGNPPGPLQRPPRCFQVQRPSSPHQIASPLFRTFQVWLSYGRRVGMRYNRTGFIRQLGISISPDK